MSSLICKCVFYRQKQHDAKGRGPQEIEMQKLNRPTDRAQRVDEKNGVLCLDVMFTPRVMVAKF